MKQSKVAVNLIRRWPILVWLPLVTTAAGETFSLAIRRYAPAAVMTDPGASRVTVLLLVFGLSTPAVASGYNAVVGAAVEGDQRPGLGRFWRGLGTYYWRLLGAVLLAGLVLAPLALSLVFTVLLPEAVAGAPAQFKLGEALVSVVDPPSSCRRW